MRGFRDASGQLVFDPDDENLSDKELYARNIPAIGRLFIYVFPTWVFHISSFSMNANLTKYRLSLKKVMNNVDD